MANAAAATKIWMRPRALPISCFAVKNKRVFCLAKRTFCWQTAELMMTEATKRGRDRNPIAGFYVFDHAFLSAACRA